MFITYLIITYIIGAIIVRIPPISKHTDMYENGILQTDEMRRENRKFSKDSFKIRGISAPYSKERFRMEQVRYSWEKLKEETGVGTEDVERRCMDYGLQEFYQSHPPYLVPEPFTPEPNETFSKDEIDEYAEIMKKVSQEAYENPELVKTAPHNGPISLIPQPPITDPEDLIVTWRVYKKKKGID